MRSRLHLFCIAWVFALTFAASSYGQTDAVSTAYRIPLVNDVVVDGSADDWGERGFSVDVMANVEGGFRSPGDFDPTLRLGWNEDGLLVLAQVRDDGLLESDIDRRLFLADSIELFVGTARDEHNYFMLLIAPGLDPKHPKQRQIFFDERDGGPATAGTLPDLRAQVEVLPSEGGYTVEALIPWINLDLTPRVGLTLAFQAYAMDRDPDDPESESFRVAWYPAFDTHQNQTSSMMALELSDAPSEPVQAVVRGRYRDIKVVADETYVGAALRVERRGEQVAQTLLVAEAGRAIGSLRLPGAPPGESLGQFEVFLNGQLLETIERGSAAAMVGIAIEDGGLSFFQNVFSGTMFPAVEFKNARLVEDLIGPFEIGVRYYGPDHQEVVSAKIPGRYGAVVTIKSIAGGGENPRRSSSRFFTLFRTSDEQNVATRRIPPWVMPDLDALTLPGGLTLTPESQADEATLDESDAVRRAAEWDQAGAVEGRSARGVDAGLADKTWWVRCKRVHYGLIDKQVSIPRPRPSALGDPDQELREGPPADAGLDAGVIEALEEICRRWVASNGGQGFTICAARHGVAFFHRAYGEDGGTPVTLATPAGVQSVSKTITGTVFMTYMDCGLIDLDVPIQSYVPLFRSVTGTASPLTIRQLLTHTSGINGHFGDEQRDLEERIADEYPQLENPVAHLYSGRAFALAVKALEAISAEAFPEIYDQVLVQPLGMKNTTVTNSHDSIYTTAWDLAKMGQLLLNGGTYGGHRYFSPQILEQAKPQAMVQIFGRNNKRTWGIGFLGSRDSERHMFSESAFGHNSGNSSCLRVDPATDLVITVASLEDRRYLTEAMRRTLVEAIEAAILDAP